MQDIVKRGGGRGGRGDGGGEEVLLLINDLFVRSLFVEESGPSLTIVDGDINSLSVLVI